MLEWLFGRREKPEKKVHIVVELRVSGAIELNGEGLGRTEDPGQGQGGFPTVSTSERPQANQADARTAKKAEPTITPDFFADDGPPPDDFGQDV